MKNENSPTKQSIFVGWLDSGRDEHPRGQPLRAHVSCLLSKTNCASTPAGRILDLSVISTNKKEMWWLEKSFNPLMDPPLWSRRRQWTEHKSVCQGRLESHIVC